MTTIFIWGDFKVNDVSSLCMDRELGNILKECDFNVVNFEAPIKSRSMPIRKSGPNISQCQDSPEWLESRGFNVVSLANNHTMDYGRDGASATKDAFKSARIIGCGTWDEAYKLEVVTSSDGKRIGFMFTWCTWNREKYHANVATYDMDWIFHPEWSVWTSHYVMPKEHVPKPKCFDRLMEVAGKLGKGQPVARVDMYVCEDKIYFGEITMTSQGGYQDFYTQDFLNKMGELTVLPIDS